jgi:hypothetical protein
MRCQLDLVHPITEESPLFKFTKMILPIHKIEILVFVKYLMTV